MWNEKRERSRRREQYEVDVKRESCRMSMVSQVYCDFDVMAQKKEWNQPSLKPNNALSLLSFVLLRDSNTVSQ